MKSIPIWLPALLAMSSSSVLLVLSSPTSSSSSFHLAGARSDGFVNERQQEVRRIRNSTDEYENTNRIQFLEWLFGLTSEPEEEVPSSPEPITEAKCEPCPCGTANKKIRIVGGKPTQVNQYPWMALLMYNKKFYCGGSLINSKYVLTAAHCVDGFNRQKITVRLLEHDRTTDSESTVIDRKVAKVIRHSGYNDRTFNNDIALLKLDEEVPIGDELRPVCLPARGKSYTKYEGLVTGWGVKSQGGVTSPVLHEVKVPIMSNAECKKTKYGNKRITDNMMCAGFPEGKKDACQGDSGGPLHVVNGTIHDIVGIVSWGEGCARPDYPGVYSRVNRYITWITKNTPDACPCSAKHSAPVAPTAAPTTTTAAATFTAPATAATTTTTSTASASSSSSSAASSSASSSSSAASSSAVSSSSDPEPLSAAPEEPTTTTTTTTTSTTTTTEAADVPTAANSTKEKFV